MGRTMLGQCFCLSPPCLGAGGLSGNGQAPVSTAHRHNYESWARGGGRITSEDCQPVVKVQPTALSLPQDGSKLCELCLNKAVWTPSAPDWLTTRLITGPSGGKALITMAGDRRDPVVGATCPIAGLIYWLFAAPLWNTRRWNA